MPLSVDPRRELFDEFFAGLHKLVYSWLLGQTGSRETAEDLMQDTFVRVWAHIDNAKSIPVEKRKTWVLILARSALGDHRRRAAVRSHLHFACRDDPVSPDSLVEAVMQSDEIDRVQRAIVELPAGLRTVLSMSVVGEMTSEEIGAALGRPAGTIRSQLFDARKWLAKRMGL